jgi:hypothetical protein
MKCEMFGCVRDADQSYTVAPGTTHKLCELCYESEFSMCDQMCESCGQTNNHEEWCEESN